MQVNEDTFNRTTQIFIRKIPQIKEALVDRPKKSVGKHSIKIKDTEAQINEEKEVKKAIILETQTQRSVKTTKSLN